MCAAYGTTLSVGRSTGRLSGGHSTICEASAAHLGLLWSPSSAPMFCCVLFVGRFVFVGNETKTKPGCTRTGTGARARAQKREILWFVPRVKRCRPPIVCICCEAHPSETNKHKRPTRHRRSVFWCRSEHDISFSTYYY